MEVMSSSSSSNKKYSRKPSKRKYQNVPGQDNNNGASEDPLALQSTDENEVEISNVNDDCIAVASMELSVDDAIDRLGMGIFQYRILIAAGLCFAADAMMVLLLSFLSVVLQSEWGLTDDETAFITSILFAGALIGTSILGPLADKWGRRPVFIMAASIIAVFGIGTCFATNYTTILVIMFTIGFGVGGLTVPFDTLAEYLPAEARGTNLLLIEYFWTIGCLLVVVFAELTLAHGKANWRLFVVLCTIPCFISIILGYLFVPESVRWLVSVGRNDEALEILRQAARINKLTATMPLTQGGDNNEDDNNSQNEDVDYIFPVNSQLTSDEDHSAENSASCLDLLKPQWRGIMLRLWGAWAGFGLGYYGAILSVTKVFDSEEQTEVDVINSSFDNATFELVDNSTSTRTVSDNATITSSATEMPDFDYSAIFISSSAELLGTTLVIILIDRLGRIPSQVFGYAAAGICIFMLCTIASTAPAEATSSDRMELVALGFLLRAFDMMATCSSWVSTAEVLPTEIRSTGHSTANAMARLGAFFSPFLVDTLSLEVLGVVMLFVHWFTAACVYGLPETKGAHMGGGGGLERDQTGSDDGSDVANHENLDGEECRYEEEVDGIFVIDDDDDGDDSNNRGARAVQLEGDGPQIHMIADYKDRIGKSLEFT